MLNKSERINKLVVLMHLVRCDYNTARQLKKINSLMIEIDCMWDFNYLAGIQIKPISIMSSAKKQKQNQDNYICQDWDWDKKSAQVF